MGIDWNEQGYFRGHFDENEARVLRKIVLQSFLDPRDFNPARRADYEKNTFFPRLAASERMRRAATELAENTFGHFMTCRSAQIALRFPDADPVPWHVDKVAAHGASLYNAPTDHHFKTDAILGLYLCSVPSQRSPLTVRPGSHRLCEAFAKEHGFKALRQGLLPEGVKEIEPHVIVGGPGTAVMMHPLLAHHVPKNETYDIRFALYFRMRKHD